MFVETVLEDQYRLKNTSLHEDSVIIDLGAQIGLFSVYASNKAKKIFAFEPVSENYDLLVKNIKLNKLENKIMHFNLAVSDKKGKEKIFLSQNHSGGHSIYGFEEFDEKKSSPINQFIKSKGFNKEKFIEVSSITLEEIFRINKIKHCDLLKMDIEGAEYKVLYNLPDYCFEKIQRIAMECHDLDEKKKNSGYVKKFLQSKGFKVELNYAMLYAQKTK
ncbi:FkbM family methyltransferase [Candidatus Micrarchaeota archaeon]|nr:FkbM family methyltransferase [Candidatus Micrarchaeota archaeon]